MHKIYLYTRTYVCTFPLEFKFHTKPYDDTYHFRVLDDELQLRRLLRLSVGFSVSLFHPQKTYSGTTLLLGLFSMRSLTN